MFEPRPTTVRLQKHSWAFTQSAVLFTAIENGLFTSFSLRGDSLATIAKDAGITENNAKRMITALLTLELVERAGDGFCNAPDVERFLVEDTRSYVGRWITWFHHQWNAWGELGKRLEDTGPEDPLGFYDESFTVDHARRYHQATASVGMGAARKFMSEVPLDGRNLLFDLGGGSGAYSIEAAKRNPGLKAVVLDLPEVVLVVTRDFIKELGADAILMNSNLPQYSGDMICQVLGKAFDALAPGGEMHICGEMVNEDWSGPLIPAMCSVHGVLFHSTALPHTPTDCIRYFEETGFEDVKVREFIPDILQHITGCKPA
mgnify:FL=1